MELSKVRRYRKKHKLISALFSHSPAVMIGLCLPFLIATSVSLRAAATLSLELLVVHMGTMVVALLACRHCPRRFRPLVTMAASTLLMVAARLWLIAFFPGIVDSLGIYIYLMAVNGLTLTQSHGLSRRSRPLPVLRGALFHVFMFSAMMFFVSFFREYLGRGTLWGIPVPSPVRLPGVLVPFFGFILAGFLLAGMKQLHKKLLGLALRERALREARFTVVEEDVIL
ncbi:MAG: Rnf-Nqr domain containing protein [Oscillospiraceae bacterium]